MSKITFEDFKRAVKAKYEIEKESNYSDFLLNPSRAKLRNLCLELFKNNNNQNDLIVFSSFFKFDYTPSSSGKLKEQTDKFRPIETFFKGETDLMDSEAVNMAAILVDFQPRPLLKFLKGDCLVTNEEPVLREPTADVNGAIQRTEAIAPVNKSTKISYKTILTIVILVATLMIGFGISHFVFQKKQCMQWSEDHYEMVDCDLKVDGFSSLNNIEPFEESKASLHKIEMCDSTECFKNGQAIIWYAKTASGIEFFNTHGRHPENNKPLKPVTQYILKKYVKK